jgi:transcriptional regulator with XRE-family HTH domain
MPNAPSDWGSESPLAQILRRERKRVGMTQGQLAARCGLYQSEISRLENGKRPPTLPEAVRLAEIFGVPLQAFLTGEVRPGTRLNELAIELRSLGVLDLIVPDVRIPGAFRPSEEVVAHAVGTNRPDPRVVEAIPAVLAANRWRAGLLDAFARLAHPRAVTRLAWLADVTLTIDRNEGFPGGLVSGDDLTDFLNGVDRPEEADDLGHPGDDSAVHRVWKYWRIGYAADLGAFRDRALHLRMLRGSPPVGPIRE